MDNYDFLTDTNEEDLVVDTIDVPEFEYINIFTAFFNKIDGKVNHVFTDINYDQINSTNRCMECLYDHMIKYKSCLDENKLCLIPIDQIETDITNNMLSDYHGLYVLSINNIRLFASEYLFTIILYLKQLEWVNIQWDIDVVKC